jgi:hypothetical protein
VTERTQSTTHSWNMFEVAVGNGGKSAAAAEGPWSYPTHFRGSHNFSIHYGQSLPPRVLKRYSCFAAIGISMGGLLVVVGQGSVLA